MSGFLKWPGGKANLIHQIKPQLDTLGGKRLVEPFVGAGNVFLSLEYDEYLLCDSNLTLINMYKSIAKEPKRFIKQAKRLIEKCNDEKTYYELREKYNKSTNVFEKSVIFFYLNRAGYRGLVRYSKTGRYNVPYGHYKNIYFPQKELEHFISIKDKCTFKHQPFKETFAEVKDGDVVYCDPPYTPVKADSFTNYTQDGFGEQDHFLLRDLAVKSVANVLISNHDTQTTRDLYDGAELVSFKITRAIKKLEVSELLAKYKKEE